MEHTTATAQAEPEKVELRDQDRSEYTGDIFIVPNGLAKVKDLFSHAQEEFLKKYPGCDLESLIVQVWFVNDENDNWYDHRYGVGTSFLPVYMLDGRSEGQTFTIETTNRWNKPCKLILTARQLTYRYRSFGRFEDLLIRKLHEYEAGIPTPPKVEIVTVG